MKFLYERRLSLTRKIILSTLIDHWRAALELYTGRCDWFLTSFKCFSPLLYQKHSHTRQSNCSMLLPRLLLSVNVHLILFSQKTDRNNLPDKQEKKIVNSISSIYRREAYLHISDTPYNHRIHALRAKEPHGGTHNGYSDYTRRFHAIAISNSYLYGFIVRSSR